jgi:hypothetical protein
VWQRAVRDGADIEDIRHGADGKIGAEGISRAKEAGRDIRGSKIEILWDDVGIQDRFCEGIAQLVPFDGRIDQLSKKAKSFVHLTEITEVCIPGFARL